MFLGMIPHKTKRGAEAMNRLKVFDGIPAPHDKVSLYYLKSSIQHSFLFIFFGNLIICDM